MFKYRAKGWNGNRGKEGHNHGDGDTPMYQSASTFSKHFGINSLLALIAQGISLSDISALPLTGMQFLKPNTLLP